MFRRALPLLAATVLVACSGGDQSGSTADSGTTTTPSSSTTDGPAAGSTTGSIEVPAALQLTAPLVGGGEIELGALAGRPVLLWFWAPW